MSGPATVEFGGTDEELEKYLLEFARGIGGWLLRDPKGGTFVVAAGSRLSTNPNTLFWKITARRDGGRVSLEPALRAFPLTRPKAHRIIAFRHAQLADFLTARARGAGREAFDALRLREPFGNFGNGVAEISSSFAWIVACGLAAMAAGLIAMTAALLPLMHLAKGEILERAHVVRAAGALAIPNPDRPLSALGAALVFAVPLAFLTGFLHALALAACELWFRADRLPLASVLCIAILLAGSLFPFTPLLALPIGIAVPLAIHSGYVLVWSRRRERVREGGRPRRRVVAVGILLAFILLATVLPSPAQGREFTDRIALFRDRFLLGSAPGRFVASVYYGHTLVGADLLKQFFSTNPDVADRLVRTAYCEEPRAVEPLRSRGFTIVLDPQATVDVRIPRGKIPTPGDLDALARGAFRGSMLREASSLGWSSIYYGGAVFMLLVLGGAFCLPVSLLFRKVRRRAALGILGTVFGASVGALLWALPPEPGVPATLKLAREGAPSSIRELLVHPSVAIRHEAAVQAFHHPDPSLGQALLVAADDPDLRVRIWACAALGKTGHPGALARLVLRLDDPELFVRYRAAEGLGFLGDRKAIEPLRRTIRERCWYEGLYALEALRRIDPKNF